MAITKFTGVTNTIQSLSDRPNQTEGLTAATLKIKFDQFAIDNKAYLNNVMTVEVDTLDAQNTKLTGIQTITGVKTFTSSPIVPTPTTEFQATPKGYIDTTDLARKLYIDTNFTTKAEITTNRKLSPSGDFTGTVNGQPLVASDPFFSTVVSELLYEKTSRTITVGTGKDFTSIQDAINSVKKYLYSGVVVDIQIDAGTYNENVIIGGFYGGGALRLNNGRIIINVNVNFVDVQNCASIINISGINATATNVHGFFLSSVSNSDLAYISATTVSAIYSGIIVFHSPSVAVSNSVFSNRYNGISAESNSKIYSENNSGSANSFGLASSKNSSIGKNGTQPAGTAAETQNAGGVIR